MTHKPFSIFLLLLCSVAAAQTTYRWTGKDGRIQYSDQPPPADARNVQQKSLGGQYIEASGASWGTQKAAREFPVTLYVSPDCGTECRVGRELLEQRGVPFAEKLIRSREDADALKKLTGGELGVPVMTVGSQVQKGFEDSLWHRALDDAGYPKTAAPSRPRK
jgi:glutaredoxin